MRLIKFNVYCGRIGSLSGVFAASERGWLLVQSASKKGLHAYFGEVLGKHSDVSITLNEACFKVLLSSPEVEVVARAVGEEDTDTGCIDISGHSAMNAVYYTLSDSPSDEEGYDSAWDHFVAQALKGDRSELDGIQ